MEREINENWPVQQQQVLQEHKNESTSNLVNAANNVFTGKTSSN